ncbi:MAG: retropepsin-like aspartic protease [Cytophagales bacterium]|nr:retropepsin-like aspartic protease [Cytophagales bacterium]
MKEILLSFSLLVLLKVSFAQTKFSLNQGRAGQTNYFSSIPYESINEKLIIKVTIKGKEYRFLLDTGAPTIISSELFNELNLDIVSKMAIRDANGVKDSLSIVLVKDLKIGEILFQNIPTMVSKQNIIFECFNVDGFIGSNLLRNSIVQFNSSTKNIIITNDQKKLILNKKQSSELFLLDSQSSPYIWVKLKNKKQVREQLLFDTGMNGLYDLSLNNLGFFQKHETFETIAKSNGSNSLGYFGIAKDTTHYRLLLPIMEINRAKLLNVTTQTTRGNCSRIGSKLLEYGVVTIDYTKRKFYFAPYFKLKRDISHKHWPIDIYPFNNQIFIGFIWDTSLIGRITKGDQITAVDGINYENINLCDLLTKEFIFKDKDKLILTTKNNKGEITETTIERK